MISAMARTIKNDSQTNAMLVEMMSFSMIRLLFIGPPFMLYFRVKFYVNDPSKLAEEYTRFVMHFTSIYHIDESYILDITFICRYVRTFSKVDSYVRKVQLHYSAAMPFNVSYRTLDFDVVVLAEFGDYCVDEHGDNYLHGYQMLPNQTVSFTNKLEQLHKLHRSVIMLQYIFVNCL